MPAAGDKQLQATFAGLLSTGVVRVHLMWGRWEAEGLPADLAAVVAAFNAAGMNITVHIIDRELHERTKGPWRRVHNANYFSAVRVAEVAEPGRMLLLLEDDVQLASFFALRLCRLVGQLTQVLVRPPLLKAEQVGDGEHGALLRQACTWLASVPVPEAGWSLACGQAATVHQSAGARRTGCSQLQEGAKLSRWCIYSLS